MAVKSFTTEAVVLKRVNVGEYDKIVTLLTRSSGKIVVVAKGVRKITSGKRATLEPGNHLKAHCIITKSLPLLTQAQLIADCAVIRSSMTKLRQLTQLLEIVDALFVESQGEEDLFDMILEIRKEIVCEEITSGRIKKQLEDLIIALGYQDIKETKYQTMLEYVAVLADKPMKSWEYLKV